MTEITLPWLLIVSFAASVAMAAYHIGRAVERVRRRHRRQSVSWEEYLHFFDAMDGRRK